MRSRLICVFLLLWLPLHGWAAVVMPFCPHSLGDDMSANAPSHGHGSGHADHQHSHPEQDRQHGSLAGAGCNDCGACHLACAPAVASAAFAVVPVTGSTQPESAPQFLSLFVPELGKPPPLA